MKLIFKFLTIAPFILLPTTAYTANQASPVAGVRAAAANNPNSTKLIEGGVTIPGSDRVYKPLPPAEEEKLGREGAKRKMMEQRP